MISSATYPTGSTDPIISRLRPRTVVEVLDHAFRMYRRHFLTFLAIIAVVHVPLQLLIQGVTVWLQMGVTDITNQSVSGGLSSSQVGNEFLGMVIALYAVVLGLSLLYSILQYLSQGALTAAIADAHLDRPVGFGSAYGAMFKHIGPLLGFMVLQILISIGIFVPVVVVFVLAALGMAAAGQDGGALGFGAICFACFLTIPAMMFLIYVFVRWTVVVPAIVIENLGPVEAMRRSWRLVQDYWWRTAAILLVLWIMSLVVALGPAAVIVGIVGLATRSFDQVMVNAVSGVVTVITTAFFVPLQLAAITLYYFDLRVRKEGFDIESAMAQRYGQPGVGGMQTTPIGAYRQAPVGGPGTPMLGYQQPADTRYIGGYTPPPGSGYTLPARGEYPPESYTTEQAAPATRPDPDSASDSGRDEQEGDDPTPSIFEPPSEPDETPRQG